MFFFGKNSKKFLDGNNLQPKKHCFNGAHTAICVFLTSMVVSTKKWQAKLV